MMGYEFPIIITKPALWGCPAALWGSAAGPSGTPAALWGSAAGPSGTPAALRGSAAGPSGSAAALWGSPAASSSVPARAGLTENRANSSVNWLNLGVADKF